MRKNDKFEEELWKAIRYLASDSKPLKKRIEEAYTNHLIWLDPNDIPTEYYRKMFMNIKNKLTKNNTVSSHEALHRMQKKTCSSIAGDLVDIYDEFIQFDWNNQNSKPEIKKLKKIKSIKAIDLSKYKNS